MPYRRSFRSRARRPVRRYGRRYRRRAYRPWRMRRRFRTSIRKRIMRQPKNHLPPRRRVRLRYCDMFSLNPPLGLFTNDTWSLNGCYDPYVAAGGHQPMGFDQWMILYENYSVINCTYQVRVLSGSSGSDKLWGVYLSKDVGGVPSVWTTLIEQQGFIWRAIPFSVEYKDQLDIKGSVNLKKWLDSDWKDVDRIGTAAANPSSQVYIHVTLGPAFPTDDIPNTRFQIILDYDVIFFNPHKQDPS